MCIRDSYDARRNLEGTVESVVFYDGTVYAGTSSGVFALDPETQRFVNVGISQSVYHLHQYTDEQDTLLVAVTNDELYEVQLGQAPQKIAVVSAWSSLSAAQLPGQLIVIAEDGVELVPRKNGRWGEPVRLRGIDDQVHNAVPDGNQGFWVGGNANELFHLSITSSDTTVTRYGTEQGVPERFTYCQYWQGELLLGTDVGIYRLKADGSGFEKHPRLTGTSTAVNGAYHRLSVDESDRLWSVWEDPFENLHLGYAEAGSTSMVPLEQPFVTISKSIVHTLAHDENGVTWLGGPEGLYRYDTRRKKAYDVAYPVFLRNVLVQGRDTIFGGAFTGEAGAVSAVQLEQQAPSLDYSQNGIKFTFSSGFYQNEEETQYRWFLEGNDANWTDWDDATEANYTNLNEGVYHFHIEARNFRGLVSETTTYTFTVAPPWYRTWWAYTLYVIAFVIFVYLVVTVATRSLRQMVKRATAEIRRQKDEIEEQKQLVDEKNKDITDSIEYASTIQTAILPAPEYLQEVLPENFILFRPRDIVSGDFYWAHQLSDGKVVATAADCTGHGVPGAFMSMIGNSLLNEIIIEKRIDKADEILNLLKDGIIRALNPEGKTEQSKDGMDLSLVVWDPNTRTVDFAGANNPLYIIRENATPLQRITGETFEPNLEEEGKHLYEIKGDKQPIGYLSERHNQPFSTHKLKAEPGDVIYLFSDGYADQFGGPKGKKFKYKPFKRLLCKLQGRPMAEQLHSLETAFEDWRGNIEQVDDVCVIGIRL